MPYRRSGRSGLLLPAISLGLWQNFGHGRPIDGQRAVIHRAFDLVKREAEAHGVSPTWSEIIGLVPEPVSYTHLTLPTNREV